MAARGTRRPHAKRVRAKKVNVSRRSGKKGIFSCGLILFAFAALPAIVAAVVVR